MKDGVVKNILGEKKGFSSNTMVRFNSKLVYFDLCQILYLNFSLHCLNFYYGDVFASKITLKKAANVNPQLKIKLIRSIKHIDK